jgi:hypothetical protein
MSEPTDPIDSKEFYELMQRYRHASAIVPASVTNAFNDVKYFIVKLLRAQRTEGRPADIRTACPHCGLFGNHLASCEYEKFTKPDQPEPDFIIHRGRASVVQPRTAPIERTEGRPPEAQQEKEPQR